MTQEELKEILEYNQITGIFKWKVSRANNKVKIGDIAGSYNNYGYIQIKIDKKLYLAHRLAWLYLYNRFPENQIDHINGIKHDNRIDNLREATHSQNQQNKKLRKTNTSKEKGISWKKSIKKWQVQISKNNINYHCGYFNTIEDAIKIRDLKYKELHDKFANF